MPTLTTPSRIQMVDVATFTQHVDAACAVIGKAEVLPPPQDRRQWREHLPELNDACADTLQEGEQVLEPGALGFGWQDMRDNGRRMEDLLKARGRAAGVVERCDEELDVCRQRMLWQTGQVMTLGRTRGGDPSRTVDYRAQVNRLYARPFEIVATVSENLSAAIAAGREQRGRVAELEDQVERKDLENRALRGAALTVDDVRPAARTGRRGQRR